MLGTLLAPAYLILDFCMIEFKLLMSLLSQSDGSKLLRIQRSPQWPYKRVPWPLLLSYHRRHPLLHKHRFHNRGAVRAAENFEELEL